MHKAFTNLLFVAVIYSVLMSFFHLLQNFDLEKKEDNSEADEDGLKAESWVGLKDF